MQQTETLAQLCTNIVRSNKNILPHTKINFMKQVSTTVKTGDKIEAPGTQLIGEIGTYKDGKIKVFWYMKNNKVSGMSENLSTRELNRRIKENKIKVLKPEAVNHS